MSVPRQVKQGLAIVAASVIALEAFAAAAPPASEILRTVRLEQTNQERVLTGRLRTGNRAIPFRLVLRDGLVRYEFSGGRQALQLRLGEQEAQMDEIAGDQSRRVTAARWDHKVGGTDITFEDLSMQFLYWPDAEVTGEGTVLTRRCWEISSRAPRESQYSRVRLWIDQRSGALLRAEGYGRDGQILRRFEVRSGQKLNGGWILKQMRIEHMEAGKPRDKEPTYLEIQI
jgi:hypothetical protein